MRSRQKQKCRTRRLSAEILEDRRMLASWKSPNDGSYGIAGNWIPGVPTSATDAQFDVDGAYTVDVPAGDDQEARNVLAGVHPRKP